MQLEMNFVIDKRAIGVSIADELGQDGPIKKEPGDESQVIQAS